MRKIIPVVASLVVLGVATESNAFLSKVSSFRCRTSVLKDMGSLGALQADIMMQQELVQGASKKQRSAQEKKLKQAHKRYEQARDAQSTIVDCLLAGKYQKNLFAQIRRFINGDTKGDHKESTGFLTWYKTLPAPFKEAIENTVNAWTESGGKDSAKLNKYKKSLKAAWNEWRNQPVQPHYAHGEKDAGGHVMGRAMPMPGGEAPVLAASHVADEADLTAPQHAMSDADADVDALDADHDEMALHHGTMVTAKQAETIRKRATQHAAHEEYLESGAQFDLGENASMFDTPEEEGKQPLYQENEYKHLSQLFLGKEIEGVTINVLGVVEKTSGRSKLVRIIGGKDAAQVGQYFYFRGKGNENALVGAATIKERNPNQQVPAAFREEKPGLAPKAVHLVPDNIADLASTHNFVGKVVAEKDGTAVVGIYLPYNYTGHYVVVDKEAVKNLGHKFKVGKIVGFKDIDQKTDRAKSYDETVYHNRYEAQGFATGVSFVGNENKQDHAFDDVVLKENMEGFSAAVKREERAAKRGAGSPEIDLRGTFLDEKHDAKAAEAWGKLKHAAVNEKNKRIQEQIKMNEELWQKVEAKKVEVEKALHNVPATAEIEAKIKKGGGFYQESQKTLAQIEANYLAKKPFNLGQLRRLGFNLRSTLKYLEEVYVDARGIEGPGAAHKMLTHAETAPHTSAPLAIEGPAEASHALVPYTGGNAPSDSEKKHEDEADEMNPNHEREASAEEIKENVEKLNATGMTPTGKKLVSRKEGFHSRKHRRKRHRARH